MAKGQIHLETGTVCSAQSDDSCPYGGTGHADSLEGYAEHHGADPRELRELVAEGRMAPKDALELIQEGHSATPAALSKSAETPQERYEREMAQYVVELRAYEDRLMENYRTALANRQSSFAPKPIAPALRTAYPKSFEAYGGMPHDFLPEDLPEEIAGSEAEDLWPEYLRKRKQMGDISRDTLYYG